MKYSEFLFSCIIIPNTMGLSFIKCPNCGTKNTQDEECTNCGTILNIVLKRQQEEERKRLQRKAVNSVPEKSWSDRIFKRFERHPNSIVRFLFTVINAIWLFCAMVVGGLIAAVIAVAAG